MDAFLRLDPSNKDKLKKSQEQKKTKDFTDKKQIKLWIEKYRPKSLDEIVFQDNVVKALKKTKQTGKMQHLLFWHFLIFKDIASVLFTNAVNNFLGVSNS